MTRDEFMDKLERELAARRVPELPYWCGVLHGLARLGLVPISTKVFARLLQKAAESRGGASGRAPQSAECPYPHKSAGGGQGGDPRRGSPLLSFS